MSQSVLPIGPLGATQHPPEFPNVRVEFSALESADYILSQAVAVERKEAGDFAASIMDRRLFGRATKTKAGFERPLVLIEGDLSGIRSAIHPEALRGAISFLAVLEGITVLHVSNAEEAAALLRTLTRHAQEGLGYEINLRGSKPKTASLYAEYLVEGLPGIGRQRPRQLLEHFGTPAAVMSASPEQLAQVPGIGTKSARHIWEALNTPYSPDPEDPA